MNTYFLGNAPTFATGFVNPKTTSIFFDKILITDDLLDPEFEELGYSYIPNEVLITAEMLGITSSQVKTIEEHALRCIRLAYSKSYMQGKKFDGEAVLHHMAERSGITVKQLSDIFDSYITEGLASGDQPYWERVKRKNENPTAAELLDFIYMKYELKINPFTLG